MWSLCVLQQTGFCGGRPHSSSESDSLMSHEVLLESLTTFDLIWSHNVQNQQQLFHCCRFFYKKRQQRPLPADPALRYCPGKARRLTGWPYLGCNLAQPGRNQALDRPALPGQLRRNLMMTTTVTRNNDRDFILFSWIFIN